MKYLLPVLASLAFVGCASGPEISTSGFVQAKQVGDAQLSCKELRIEIDRLDEAQKAIARKGQINAFGGAVNQFNSSMGGMGRFGALSSALNVMQGSLLSKMVQDNDQAANSRQERRNVLMQQFNAMSCSA